MRWLIALAALSCASHKPLEPALFSPQMANDRSIVVGRILGAPMPDSLGWPHIVVMDTTGRPYQLRVIRNTAGNMKMVAGLRVTAWCHGVGPGMVADSVRVEEQQ